MTSGSNHVLISAGGPEQDPEALRSHIGEFKKCIAADGGLRLLKRLEFSCDLLVGDFDTLSPEEVQEARECGLKTKRFSPHKDQSDLELAILEAISWGASHVTIIGALGGEWDHTLLNLLAPLSLCSEHSVQARLLSSEVQIYLLDSSASLNAQGQRVSLCALSKVVNGLKLKGFQYDLDSVALKRSQTLGLANRAQHTHAKIEFESGELLLALLN